MAYSVLCTVANAGVKLHEGNWRAALFLKSDQFLNGKNFVSAPNMTREVLAVALAAITSGKQVYCEILDDTAEWPELSQINLLSGK